MTDVLEFIKSVGFPIFVAVVCLLKVTPALNALNSTLASLTEVMRKCTRE